MGEIFESELQTLRITCDSLTSQLTDLSGDSDPIRSLTLKVNSNGPNASINAGHTHRAWNTHTGSGQHPHLATFGVLNSLSFTARVHRI